MWLGSDNKAMIYSFTLSDTSMQCAKVAEFTLHEEFKSTKVIAITSLDPYIHNSIVVVVSYSFETG